jgi:hypothetical protein
MDLDSTRYFELLGMATDGIRTANAGAEHSGLSPDQLKDLRLVIDSSVKSLREAVRAVLEEPFFSAH